MDFIEGIEWQLIESGIVILLYVLLRTVFHAMIDRVGQ